MDIKDGVPERRNLTMLAMTIIVFYIGEATFEGGKAKLMLLNVEFHNLVALKYLAFVMLCWFLFRYIVASIEPFQNAIKKDVRSIDAKENFIRCTDVNPDIVTLEEVWVNWHTGKKCFGYNWTKNKSPMYSDRKYCLYLFLASSFIKQFFTKPTISAYIAPILLTGFAFYMSTQTWDVTKKVSDVNVTAVIEKADSNKTSK